MRPVFRVRKVCHGFTRNPFSFDPRFYGVEQKSLEEYLMSKNNIHKERILFICTHNSARSQIAEGILTSFYGDKYEAYSAGTQATRVNPLAIKVLAEIDIDISAYRAKDISEFKEQKFKYVVTVCDHARETCPFFPNGKVFLHSSFIDPSQATGTEQEILSVFRSVRESIREWIQNYFG